MKKKPKKKIKQKSHKLKKKKKHRIRTKSKRGKIKKFIKRKKAKSKKKIKISRKIKKRKVAKKRKTKTSLKASLSSFNKIKILNLKKQRKHLAKLSFQKVINFVLQPIFRAYEDFREKRKIEKLRKIALEKKEIERQIKEERRLRYEAKQQELRDEIKLARERSQDLKKFIRQEQAILRKEQAGKRRRFL